MFLQGATLLLLLVFLSLPTSSFSQFQYNPFPFRPIHGPYHRHRYPASRHTHFGPDRYSTFPQMARRNPHRDGGAPTYTVNVDHFGARGDGSDDTEAFIRAWEEACSAGGVLMVPTNKVYQLKPVTFSGPCKSGLTLRIYGTIEASVTESDYEKNSRYWLVFQNVQDFRVEGGGVIDGKGKMWWEKSCKVNKDLPCKEAPTAMTFDKCQNLRVADLWFQNSQQMHLRFDKCNNVYAYNLLVTAPGDSPNTDGIHVSETQNVIIKKSVIRTGDDCISIVSGSKFVQAMDITCGPGHGISIGSLGADDSEAYVSDVLVNRARLSGTTNGVRIKTWQGGSGYARNIKFLNILMHNVSNPILIDQNYCDQDAPCPEKHSAVQVSNVLYQNIRGTSASEVATKFDCSKSFPCEKIFLEGVNLRSDDGRAQASCENVVLTDLGEVSPQCSAKGKEIGL